MELTYILVDFENIQPLDMGLLNGDQYQLRIFRGPHQKKLDFDIVEALQPLGDRVKYLQSDRHGKNALDLHIAFYMGRLLQELEADGSPERKATRFVVISHDGGFDALMGHVQSLGYAAMKAASIRQALGLDELITEAGNGLQPMLAGNAGLTPHNIPRSSPVVVSRPPRKPPAAKKVAPVAKAPPVKPAATPKKTATAQAKPSKAAERSLRHQSGRVSGRQIKKKSSRIYAFTRRTDLLSARHWKATSCLWSVAMSPLRQCKVWLLVWRTKALSNLSIPKSVPRYPSLSNRLENPGSRAYWLEYGHLTPEDVNLASFQVGGKLSSVTEILALVTGIPLA